MLRKLIIFAQLGILIAYDEVAINVMWSKRKTCKYDIEFYSYNDNHWDVFYDNFANLKTHQDTTQLIVKIKNQLQT